MKDLSLPKGKNIDAVVCKTLAAEMTAKAIEDRLARFDKLFARQTELLKSKEQRPIEITLPDGKTTPGVAFQTTPLEIALKISKKLAEKCIVAKVAYSKKDGAVFGETVDVDEEAEASGQAADHKETVIDLSQPLEGDCKLTLLTIDDPLAQRTFRHSSAHVLGRALERLYQAYLCHGPPTEDGFFYDSFTGDVKVSENDFAKIEKSAEELIKKAAPFQKLILSKEEALDLFRDNPFKQVLIKDKIKDGQATSAYRCGDFVDLCTGPHVPSTGIFKAFKVTKNAAAYWKGKATLDDLQRVYGVSFPSKAELDEYLALQQRIKEQNHKAIGERQKLFHFNEFSPGSCFFLPHGTKIFNKMVEFMRKQYHYRGFKEVNTPNMFKNTLWKTSGHYFKYKENIFFLEIEDQEFGLKPMNCPSHCVMFDSELKSFRDLPLRFADFGVLHRNEASGALAGLTRVRKFHQDDAHIYISEDQIEQEITDQINFLRYVYNIFGFKFEFELSTRPELYLGTLDVWNKAEAALKSVLDKNVPKWKLNPGDGAIYGPKIDVKIKDCMNRAHQLGTIQLDFVQPIRFNLQYRDSDDKDESDGEGEKPAEAEKKAKDAKKTKEAKAEGQEHKDAHKAAEGEHHKKPNTDKDPPNPEDLKNVNTGIRSASAHGDEQPKGEAKGRRRSR